MLAFLLSKGKLSERKDRPFAVACCRRIWPLLTDERSRTAVDIAERSADGNVDDYTLAAAARTAYAAAVGNRAYEQVTDAVPEYAALYTIGVIDATGAVSALKPSFNAVNAAFNCAAAKANLATFEVGGDNIWQTTLATEQAVQADLLRDIVGHPFGRKRVRRLPVAPSEVALAQLIHDERSFDRLPELARALQQTGCTEAQLLNHFRSPGPHVRGCFALDSILQRE